MEMTPLKRTSNCYHKSSEIAEVAIASFYFFKISFVKVSFERNVSFDLDESVCSTR